MDDEAYMFLYLLMLCVLAVVLGIKCRPKSAAAWLTAFFVIASTPLGNGAALLGTGPFSVVFYPVSLALYWLNDKYRSLSHFSKAAR